MGSSKFAPCDNDCIQGHKIHTMRALEGLPLMLSDVLVVLMVKRER